MEMRIKKKGSDRSVLFWAALIVLSSLFILAYLAIFGNTDQAYKDIVVETVAQFASNKSAEIWLLYILIFGGSAACLLWHIRAARDIPAARIRRAEAGCDCECFALCALLTSAIGYLVIFQGTNPLLLAMVLLAVVLFCMDRELIVPGLCTFAVIAYAVQALYRIYAALGGERSTNYMTVAILSALLTAAPLARPDRKRALLRAGMIAQMLIPGLLLVFIQSKYRYNGEIVRIGVPAAVYVFVVVLMVGFFGEAYHRFAKHWKKPANLSDTISVGSCTAIMVFNFFTGTGAIWQLDMHHPFENIIGYYEIFQQGMVPFQDYLPISGMYSVPHGAVFQLFGNGLMSNYNVANNVFFALIIILTVVLLCAHLEKSYVLLISVYFFVSDYDRSAFILPIMLLLASPKLIEKKNRWLKAWFLTSLLHGLYYPIYGAAVCAAFIPLGIWQIKTYITSGELKRDVRTAGFWVWWVICLAPAVLSLPLLIGTFKHISALAGQSVLADGIARFGQVVPGSVLSYMNDYQAVRSAFFYVITFLVPALCVWIALSAALKAGGVSLTGRKIRVEHVKEACLGLALVIMPPIVYTFSAIRTDRGVIYSRNACALLAGAVLLIIYVHCYLKDKRGWYAAYCFAFFIVVSTPGLGLTGNEAKMTAVYNVPDGYVYVNKDPVEKMGEGYVSSAIYDDIAAQWERTKTLDRDRSYFGNVGNFGHYYLYDLKGAASIEIYGTVRGYGAATEAAEVLRRTDSIVGAGINVVRNYYFYNWLLTSGEYCWSDDIAAFLPAEETMDFETTKEFNKNVGMGRSTDIGQTYSALGSSFDSLKELFSDPGVDLDIQTGESEVSIDLSRTIDGDDADFLYLEFDGMTEHYKYYLYNKTEYEQAPGPIFKLFTKKHYNPEDVVIVTWTDDNGEAHRMSCSMGKGKLLIPLGAGVKWLLHDHDSLTITAARNNEQITVPELVNAKLLKLREVG